MSGSSREERAAGRLAALGVRDSDLEEAFVRSGGKGGQNVNKVSTCVLLRHLPTGLAVRCDAERSQAANRSLARERLAAALEAARRAERLAAVQAREKALRKSRWPPRAVRERRLEDKRLRSRLKRGRAFGARAGRED